MRPIIAAVLVVVGVSAFAQSRATGPAAAIKNPVAVRGKYLSLVVGTSATTVVPGARVTLLVQVTPRPKIHVYAPGQDGYIAADLSVTPNPAFTVKPLVYPPSRPYKFAPTEETVKVYDEPFQLSQELVLAASAAIQRRAASGDNLTVTGAFKYQACDDAVCYRPETVALTWTLRLTTPSQKSKVRSQK